MPWKYNIRSLVQRPLRSSLTLLGVSLSVFLAVLMLSLSRGLAAAMVETGEPLNVLVLSKGAESVEFSALEPQTLNILANIPGVKLADGQRLVSPEINVNSLVNVPGSAVSAAPVMVRGVYPEVAFAVHPQVQISEGRAPQRGYELAVGPLVATRLGMRGAELNLGDQLEFEGASWNIVGKLSAPGTAFESEIWTQLDDLKVASKRDDLSAIVLVAENQQARDGLLFDLKTRTDVRTTVHTEKEYFAAAANEAKPIQLVALLMTVLLISGGLLSGMNTMFNSVMGRIREMAVLHVLGYRRNAVLTSFVLESLLLSVAGGVLGCLGGLALSGMPMKFSTGAFRFLVDGSVLATGLGMSVLIGILGAGLPVMRVARLKTVEGLRAQA
jgi:putative ABC transport system permease protein